jgi:hypothetical protein
MKKVNITLIVIVAYLFNGFLVKAQFQVETNTKFKLADTNISIYIDNKGRYNQANNYVFDSTTGNSNGLAIEYGVSNTGGLFVNGNTMIIWNTGQNNRLLRIFDADAMDSNTAEKWYLDGEGWEFINSDSNRKERIKTIDSSLNKITLLRAVEYHHKKIKNNNLLDSTSNQNMVSKNSDNQYYGFLAQEVKNVIPTVIGSDENGRLSINYVGLIPLLTQAIKEQQNMITTQSNNISTLTQQIEDLQNQIQVINTKINK